MTAPLITPFGWSHPINQTTWNDLKTTAARQIRLFHAAIVVSVLCLAIASLAPLATALLNHFGPATTGAVEPHHPALYALCLGVGLLSLFSFRVFLTDKSHWQAQLALLEPKVATVEQISAWNAVPAAHDFLLHIVSDVPLLTGDIVHLNAITFSPFKPVTAQAPARAAVSL